MILKNILPTNTLDSLLAYFSNVVAVSKSYVNYFDFSSGSITSFGIADTYVKLEAATTQGFSNNGLVMTSDNRIENTSSSKICSVNGAVNISGSNNNEIDFAFFLDEVLVPCSAQSLVLDSGGRASSVSFQCIVEIPQNSYIEVWCKNKAATNPITLVNVNVIVKEM
jgi:hypothetical protein